MISKSNRHRVIALSVAVLGLSAISTGYADYPIAGVNPSSRPEGAPKITTVEKNEAWYRRALTGISQPYPASLSFLEDQGNWYTPFDRPGMTGPYDIRGWHKADGN